jgi:hypothetical protein
MKQPSSSFYFLHLEGGSLLWLVVILVLFAFAFAM